MISTGKLALNFHLVAHKWHEEVIGHKLYFTYHMPADGISATANMDGFTVLNAIKMRFGWDTDLIRAAVDECNRRQEVAVIHEVSPTLFLVPRTNKDNGNHGRFLMRDLIAAANVKKILKLQFTHYSFLNRLAFEDEVIEVLKVVLDPKLETTIEIFVLDVDYRISTGMHYLIDKVRHEDYGIPFKELGKY